MDITDARPPSRGQTEAGAIDCDLHPVVPNLRALLPYLEDHWRDMVVQRGVHELELDRLSAQCTALVAT